MPHLGSMNGSRRAGASVAWAVSLAIAFASMTHADTKTATFGISAIVANSCAISAEALGAVDALSGGSIDAKAC